MMYLIVIFDLGYHPKEFKGTKMGVFIGVAEMDHDVSKVADKFFMGTYTVPGSSRAMLANRISYWLDIHG